MSKYDVLKNKLSDILIYTEYMIKNLKFQSEISRKYLMKFKDFVEYRIKEVENRAIPNSRGIKTLGLIKSISDYSEICKDNYLWNLLCEAENYYKYKCINF